jgi:hypothetical protein
VVVGTEQGRRVFVVVRGIGQVIAQSAKVGCHFRLIDVLEIDHVSLDS